MSQRRTITLTLECTDEEVANLMKRFTETATAVVAPEEDEGPAGDPNGSKVDNAGVVWDARYHGKNMAKNQDGTWRRQKGLSEQLKKDADEYETGCKLKASSDLASAAVGGVAPVAAPVVAPSPEVPAFLQSGSFAAAPAPIMGLPGMPAAPVPFTPPAPPPAPTYQEVIAAFGATIARVGQPIVDANLMAIYTNAGVTDTTQLEADGEKRRAVVAGLNALVAA